MIWPQLVVIGFLAFVLGVKAMKPQQNDQESNFSNAVVFVALWVTVLYYGGFWNPLLGG